MKSSRPIRSALSNRQPSAAGHAIVGVVLLAVLGLLLAACGGGGSSSESSSSPSEGSGGKLASQLPAKYREAGEFKVAMEADYPPAEFIEPSGSTIVGIDPEVIAAVGEQLGVKISLQNTTFDALLPGISSGKYDMAISAISATAEREKVFDLVSYFNAGTSLFVGENGPEVSGLEELCGHSIAVQRGTIDQELAEEQKKKCDEGGGGSLTVNVFPEQAGANLAITSGRAEVGMADSPVVGYEVTKSNGKLKLSGEPFESAPYAIVVPKESGLAKPILAAVKAIMADGTYDEILKKWGVESGALEDPSINPAAE